MYTTIYVHSLTCYNAKLYYQVGIGNSPPYPSGPPAGQTCLSIKLVFRSFSNQTLYKYMIRTIDFLL